MGVFAGDGGDIDDPVVGEVEEPGGEGEVDGDEDGGSDGGEAVEDGFGVDEGEDEDEGFVERDGQVGGFDPK